MRTAAVMSPQDLNAIFSNIGQLLLLTEDIVATLAAARQKPLQEQKIGEAFKSKIPYLRLYIEYCAAQEKAHEIVSGAMKGSKFREFMERIRTGNPAARKLDILSFLIKPTQRITK